MRFKKSKLCQLVYFSKYKIKTTFTNDHKKPLLCGFKITNRCNLKCSHCPFWKKEMPENLLWPKVKFLIDQLYDAGVRLMIFEGGEPLLYKDEDNNKDIRDVIAYAKEKFFITAVTTNGTIDFCSIDPDIIFISMDGPKEIHEKIRGRCFDRIVKNIDKARADKKIIVNITISLINFKEIFELIRFLDKKVFGITIQFFYPYAELEDYSLKTAQKENVLSELIQLKKKGVKILNSVSCLKRMAANTWSCNDFLVSSVEADGMVSYGCYLKNRVEKISCADCGFTAHCEISLAYQLILDSIMSASKIFWG